MYRPGKILKSGTWADAEFPNLAVTNRAAVIDMTAASPAWRETSPMANPRSYHNMVAAAGRQGARARRRHHLARHRPAPRCPRAGDLGSGHRGVDADGAPPDLAHVPRDLVAAARRQGPPLRQRREPRTGPTSARTRSSRRPTCTRAGRARRFRRARTSSGTERRSRSTRPTPLGSPPCRSCAWGRRPTASIRTSASCRSTSRAAAAR